MSLTIEWRRRLKQWRKELARHFYRPLGVIDLSGLVTTGQLTRDEASSRRFEPMPPGTKWGAKWEYGWFAGQVVLPKEAEGKRIALAVDVGAEGALVFVDGRIAGAKDQFHHHITLSTSGVPETRYDLLIEAYAGHGPRVEHVGPAPPDRETVPEPGPTQATVGESTFGVWEEEVYQLWVDVETLYQIRENIDPDSLRVAEIDRGLREFTLIVDYELPHAEMLETVHACRERLKPLLACVNGSTAPTMFAFGHGHLDLAWLWPLAETERKIARTLGNQLALMEEYPQFKFFASQPHLFHMVKTRYPALYERVRAAVEAEQLIAEGSTWIEPDTNIPSGESLIRQFIYGKRFFRQEFGIDCKLLWLPDVFGYSGALPQIMRGCGVRYFSTAKIFWASTGGDPFPYNTFTWEGIDGSEVLVHLHNNYTSRAGPSAVIERWKERVQKDGFSTRLFPFGCGDGGGGPTRDHVEFALRQRDLEGVPRVRFASPLEYFEEQEAAGWPEARYVGELYLQAHQGTYTSQARTKRGNRKSEFALREAEMWGAAAGALAGFEFPTQALRDAWTAVLLNQFHDILPGSSIHRVHEEAEAAYENVMRTAEDVARQAAASVTDDAQALTVFNSLSWERSALVALPKGFDGAVDGAGAPLPVQTVAGTRTVEAVVPPCGWTTLYPGQSVEPDSPLKAESHLLENDLLRVTLNEQGEITSIFDKEVGRELAGGRCNRFRMYKDVPASYDAWEIDSMYHLTPFALDAQASLEVVAQGPLVVAIRVTKTLHESTMTQEVRLRRGSRRIDFHTVIDWQERHKLLKVSFPVNVHASEAIHEIQFGHIRRPNHSSRQFDADRFEVAAHKWTALAEEHRGCAVLNDCKYGVSVRGNTINLTLLKSALAPDMTADRGRQAFTYAFYAWHGSFAESDVVREAYDLNCPVMVAAGEAGERSLFSVDAPNVTIETVKPAEDGSGDLILRLYESKRTATRCALTTSLPVRSATQTNMLEEAEAASSCDGGSIPLEFRPFEVKTLRLRVA